jgi:hypothetical protein
MAIYYCDYHGTHHDGDWHPCVEVAGFDLVCEEAAAEIEEEREVALMPNNHKFTPAQQAFITKMENEDENND